MVRLDVAYIFQHVGGPKALFTALEREWPAAGLHYATVQMWQQRDSISQLWQIPVLYVMIKTWGVAALSCMVDDQELVSPSQDA